LIPPCGTFDYVAIVPDPEDRPGPWPVRLRAPVELSGDSLADSRLVGIAPRLQITDAGVSFGRTGLMRPKVLRTQFALIASERDRATVSAASFHVDKALISALRPRDVLNMTRTYCGGLGMSVIRDGELVVAVGAVTAVPLGNNVEAQIPSDLVDKAEAVFKKRDPDFELTELPVEVRVGDQGRVLYVGTRQLEQYQVWVAHGFYPGIPGVDECLALSLIGKCSVSAANASAMLLDSDGLSMAEW